MRRETGDVRQKMGYRRRDLRQETLPVRRNDFSNSAEPMPKFEGGSSTGFTKQRGKIKSHILEGQRDSRTFLVKNCTWAHMSRLKRFSKKFRFHDDVYAKSLTTLTQCPYSHWLLKLGVGVVQ